MILFMHRLQRQDVASPEGEEQDPVEAQGEEAIPAPDSEDQGTAGADDEAGREPQQACLKYLKLHRKCQR